MNNSIAHSVPYREQRQYEKAIENQLKAIRFSPQVTIFFHLLKFFLKTQQIPKNNGKGSSDFSIEQTLPFCLLFWHFMIRSGMLILTHIQPMFHFNTP